MSHAAINPLDHTGLAWKLAYRYAPFINDPAVDVDDLSQDGMAALVVASRKYRGDRGTKFGTYGWRGVTMAVRNRKQLSQRRARMCDTVPAVPGTHREFAAVDRADLCRRLMAVLSPRQRMAVRLWMAGSNATMVGRQIGVSRPTASQIIVGALDLMRHTRIAKGAA